MTNSVYKEAGIDKISMEGIFQRRALRLTGNNMNYL